MNKILSVILFLFVAHQAFSQFNSIAFQKKLLIVKVIRHIPYQPNAEKSDLKFISELIQPAKKERGVVLTFAPLDYFFMTSNFGFRIDPFSKEYKFHRGIDLKTNRSKVYSMLHGKIVFVGNDLLLGNFVKVQHGKYQSIYGRATGDHLHLTIKKGDEYINPVLFIRMISKLTRKEELITYLSKQ